LLQRIRSLLAQSRQVETSFVCPLFGAKRTLPVAAREAAMAAFAKS
jgi:hypothetical protein